MKSNLLVLALFISSSASAQVCTELPFLVSTDSVQLADDLTIEFQALGIYDYYRWDAGRETRSANEGLLHERSVLDRLTTRVYCGGDTVTFTNSEKKTEYAYSNRKLTLVFDPSHEVIEHANYQAEYVNYSQKMQWSFELVETPLERTPGQVIQYVGARSSTFKSLEYKYEYLATQSSERSSFSKITDSASVRINVFLPARAHASPKISDSKPLNIWPNPANSFVKVSDNEGVHRVDIRDIFGKLVLSKVGNGSTIDLQSLMPGSYVVEANGKSKKLLLVR